MIVVTHHGGGNLHVEVLPDEPTPVYDALKAERDDDRLGDLRASAGWLLDLLPGALDALDGGGA